MEDILKGKKFGKLTVVENSILRKNKKIYIKVICDCGEEYYIAKSPLVTGKITHCKKCRNSNKITHNMSKTRLYQTWKNMKARCYYKKYVDFPNYGGRSIKVCEEWLNDFVDFKNWAIANGYNDKLTIDRINVNGEYSPNNCRWISSKNQNYNKRNTIYVKYKKSKVGLAELCASLNKDVKVVRSRLNRGYDLDKALNKQIEKHYKERKMKVDQIDKNTGIKINTFESMYLASKNTNVLWSSISNCINGKAKTAGGFVWRRNYE